MVKVLISDALLLPNARKQWSKTAAPFDTYPLPPWSSAPSLTSTLLSPISEGRVMRSRWGERRAPGHPQKQT